jgi:hypothetical protein
MARWLHGINILWLIGYRSRFLVFAKWALTYVDFERGARLITTTCAPSAAARAVAVRLAP